ncbi:MAG TPA: methyltransferase domain-containing protein [Planctomycetota bacterium]|nr:methyltransferase domain-containing protein [Planctomycetota bacterium]
MTQPPPPQPGTIEYEFGVAIPGAIQPPEKWTRTALKKLPPPPLDFDQLFGRSAPLVLDLGCGNGRYTLLSALARPGFNHFAIDVLPAVIRYATRRANQRGLAHVRFAVKDAQAFMRDYVPAGKAAEVHLYHPQPFHDRREAHMRVVTPRFLADVHRGLAPNGLFVFQTDSPEYWQYTKAIAAPFFDFKAQEGPWPDAPEGRTRREIFSRSRGVEIFRGSGIRRDGLSDAEIEKLVKTLPPPTFKTRGAWMEIDELERRGVAEE